MCLWARVGGWETSMWPRTTIDPTTGGSCIIASMAPFEFWVMTFTHPARAALFALVRVLAEKEAVSLQHLCLFWGLTEKVWTSVLTSLLSTEPSQLRPVTWGKPSLLLLLLLMVGMSLSKNGLSSGAVSNDEMLLVPFIQKVHYFSQNMIMESCPDLCCCCSGHPTHWWVRSHHESKYCRSVHRYPGMSCIPVAQHWSLWGWIRGISKPLF